MISVALNYRRPVPVRWLVLAGLVPALVLALVVALWSTEAKKECRGGAFSAGFERGFEVRRCNVVVSRLGQVIARIPLERP